MTLGYGNPGKDIKEKDNSYQQQAYVRAHFIYMGYYLLLGVFYIGHRSYV